MDCSVVRKSEFVRDVAILLVAYGKSGQAMAGPATTALIIIFTCEVYQGGNAQPSYAL